MRIRSVHLKYFKRFRDRTLHFFDPETGLPYDVVVLVGSNGTGKSSVLQAIASVVGVATKRLDSPGDLNWPGFDVSLIGNSWNLPSHVSVDVSFSPDEIAATMEYFHKVPGLANIAAAEPPSEEPNVTLTLRDGDVRANTRRQYFQFRGREYARQVFKIASEGYDVFKRVGTIFWYTEHRTATSLTSERDDGKPLQYDENLLRRRLADFLNFHLRVERNEYSLRPGQRDLFPELERAYATVFPTRRFEGPVPRPGVDEVLEEPWFYLWDGVRQYEISEMSGGERAIFPMLFDFANWNINNSIILIDEIELHLHPPLQQGLLRALSSLGTNNQFIITTHSDWVANVVPPECVVRLED